MEQYRYSERGVLKVGDLFRARGGPTFKDSRVGVPGRYRLEGIETKGDRVWLVAHPVDKYGIQSGGTYLIYAEGAVYPLDDFGDWIVRPYTIAKIRETTRPKKKSS